MLRCPRCKFAHYNTYNFNKLCDPCCKIIERKCNDSVWYVGVTACLNAQAFRYLRPRNRREPDAQHVTAIVGDTFEVSIPGPFYNYVKRSYQYHGYDFRLAQQAERHGRYDQV